jgi:curved DNA-binding protein CbpA
MQYFKNIETLEALRKAYLQYALKFHPDKGGNIEKFKEMQAEYESLLNGKINSHNFNTDKPGHKTTYEYEQSLRDIIDALMSIPDLIIEICGSWVWVRGKTYENRNALKYHGLRYSKGKKAWYYTRNFIRKKNYKGLSMGKIRKKYGSKVIKSENKETEKIEK